MAGFKTPEVEENVGCNLIPMIDIMFLMLLFFMLSADMSQRELEELTLPKADQAREDPKQKDLTGRTTINVFHRLASATFSCPAHENKLICRNPDHWLIAIRSNEFTWDTLPGQLADEAKVEWEPTVDAKAGKRLSARSAMIRADKLAPYGIVNRVIEECGKAGLYKVEIGAGRPSAEKKT